MWGIASVLWGIPSVLWRLFSTVGDNISTVGDSFSAVEGIQYIGRITSVHAGDNISTVGDNISTVEGIQYSGGRILISACLVINNDENISTFFVKFSFGSFSKIQADFMPFESWTGGLKSVI